MKIYFLNKDYLNEKYIVEIINNLNNEEFILIKTKLNIEKILYMLPSIFDDYADITNNNNLLLLYNTKKYKIRFKKINNNYLFLIIDTYLIIFIHEIINESLINSIKKLIKLSEKNSIITNIYINMYNDEHEGHEELRDHLNKLSRNISIIHEIKN